MDVAGGVAEEAGAGDDFAGWVGDGNRGRGRGEGELGEDLSGAVESWVGASGSDGGRWKSDSRDHSGGGGFGSASEAVGDGRGGIE